MSSIQKRPDGRWRARYRDDAGREHARHFDRKIDGQRWLDEVTASVVTGVYVDPGAGRVTFDAYYRTWSERQVWAPMTEVQMDLVRRTVPFGSVSIASLRTSHLEAWVKSMVSAGYAPTTVATRTNAVRAALRAAVRDRLISVDPSTGVRLPARRRREHAMQVPTPEQVRLLLDASNPRMRAYLALCAFAGLRLGEASAVSLDDVDFLGRTLHVQRQVQRTRGGPAELRQPKYGSERTVYLPNRLVEILAVHIERIGTGVDGWLFFTADDRPLPPSTVNSWWQKTLRDARTPGVHLHAMRHFYASGLIATGCDVVTVQRALGHRSPSTTLDTYSHLWPSAEDRTREGAATLADLVLGPVADSVRTAKTN